MGGYNPIDDFSFLKGLSSGLLEADKSQLQSPQDGNSSHCKPSLLFAKLLWLHVLMGRDCLCGMLAFTCPSPSGACLWPPG